MLEMTGIYLGWITLKDEKGKSTTELALLSFSAKKNLMISPSKPLLISKPVLHKMQINIPIGTPRGLRSTPNSRRVRVSPLVSSYFLSPLRMLSLSKFESLFREASPRLLAIAIAICKNRDSAQDLVQEAGLIAWRKRSDFAVGTNFGAWVGQIVRNLARRHNRDTGRRAVLSLDESSLPSRDGLTRGAETTVNLPPDGSLSSEAIGDQLGIDDEMAKALRGLSEDARSCFLLRTVGGLSYDEIAQTLDLAHGTAMSHVHRSRKRILLVLSNDLTPSKSPTDHEETP